MLGAVEGVAQAQLAPAKLEPAYRYADRRVALMARKGQRGDAAYAEELVQDAIADTCTGALRWDPERSSLVNHLVSVVRFRTKDALKRAEQLPHLSMGDCVLDRTDELVLVEEEAEQALAEHHVPPASAELQAIARQTMEELRLLTGDDVDVMCLLDCFEEGITDRGESSR